MKTLILFLLTANLLTAQQKEYFTVSTSIDPVASYNDGFADIVAEIEYVGIVYAKAGFEYFPVLSPQYFDVHGAMGFNLKNKKVRAYSGIRLGRIFREDKSRGELFGLEGGIDYSVSERVFIGLRFTRDYRNDGVVLGWDPYWRNSGFIRIGYQWDWKNEN